MSDEEFVTWAKEHPHSSYTHFQSEVAERIREENLQRLLDERTQLLRQYENVMRGRRIVSFKLIDEGNMESWEDYRAPEIEVTLEDGTVLNLDYNHTKGIDDE